MNLCSLKIMPVHWVFKFEFSYFSFLYRLYFFFACTQMIVVAYIESLSDEHAFYETCFYWVRIMCFNCIKHLLLWTMQLYWNYSNTKGMSKHLTMTFIGLCWGMASKFRGRRPGTTPRSVYSSSSWPCLREEAIKR